MATSENAKLQMEAGQSLVSQTTLTDSGDHLVFTSADSIWSGAQGYEPVVMPNGVRTGAVITPKAGTNDAVSVSASTLNLNGVDTTVAAADVTAITRPASAKVKKISIVVTSVGAYGFTAGADGDSFSDVRAANGGPPLVAVDKVEVGQVWLDSNTAAVVTSDEIRQIIGVHREVYNYPVWTENQAEGQVEFAFAAALDHTGPVAKRVYVEYYTPQFANVQHANTVKPPEASYSLNSDSTFDGPIGSATRSLGQGSFEVKLDDGINDLVVQNKAKKLWFKFFPSRYKSAYTLFQGYLGVTRTFTSDSQNSAACTVSAEREAVDVPN